MRWTSALAIYFLFWVFAAFITLPFGVRTAGGRYVFPLDIDERIDDRERKILARLERLQAAGQAARDAAKA